MVYIGFLATIKKMHINMKIGTSYNEKKVDR